jgi:hypothetical protein
LLSLHAVAAEVAVIMVFIVVRQNAVKKEKGEKNGGYSFRNWKQFVFETQHPSATTKS